MADENICTIVWENSTLKIFVAGVTRRKLNKKILLTVNKKVMFFIHWRLQETKIFYHKQISHENIQRWIFFQTTVCCVPSSSFLSVVSYKCMVVYSIWVKYIDSFLRIMKIELKVTVSRVNQHINFTFKNNVQCV